MRVAAYTDMIQWENGNMTKVSGGFEGSWTGFALEDPETGERSWSWSYTEYETREQELLSYSSVVNQPLCSIDLNWMFTGLTYYDMFGLPAYCAAADMCGVRSSKMVSSITSGEGGADGHITFDYELDRYGFVKEATTVEQDDEDGTIVSVCTVHYLDED